MSAQRPSSTRLECLAVDKAAIVSARVAGARPRLGPGPRPPRPSPTYSRCRKEDVSNPLVSFF